MNIRSVLVDTIDGFHQYHKKDEPEKERSALENKTSVTVIEKSDISGIIDKLNKATKQLNEKITFSYHEKLNRVIVKVHDSETDEVIREFPPKDLIKILEHIQEYLGLLVDESR